MSSPPSTPHQNIFSLLEKQALRFFTLLLIVFCVFLVYFGPQFAPTYKEDFISIGTSLFASLIFALLYSAIVEQHHQAVVNEELSRNVKKAVDDMKVGQQTYMQNIVDHTLAKIEEVEKSHYHEISMHFRNLIPARSFSQTTKPDKEFNQILADELSHSRSYFFKGVTGRYIAGRLAVARRPNLICKVLLTDPSSKDLLRLYVKDRFGITSSSSDVDKHIEQVRREIYMTIVDLFDLAQWTTPVELKMYHGPVFYRTELLDEFFIISYFTPQLSASGAFIPTAYPPTHLYKKDSFYYEAYLTDFNQTFELADKSINLNSKTTEQVLIDFLVKIGADPATLPQLRRGAEEFRQHFLDQFGWQ